MRFRLPLVTLAGVALLGGACRDVPEPPGRPTTLETHPRAMDRLARLMREQFTSPDPVHVERRIRCESRRVERALRDDFTVRRRLLLDSLRLEFTSEQFNELGKALATATLPADGDPICADEDREAASEAPLGGGGEGRRN